MTFLYVVLSLPRAISRPWILFRWKKSIGADREKLRVIFIGFLCCSCLTYITGKLVSLDLSVDSMFIDFFFNFSPGIIYAYPFVFLNPLELEATPAKERIVFLFILI